VKAKQSDFAAANLMAIDERRRPFDEHDVLTGKRVEAEWSGFGHRCF
jgi:hypothetical protein